MVAPDIGAREACERGWAHSVRKEVSFRVHSKTNYYDLLHKPPISPLVRLGSAHFLCSWSSSGSARLLSAVFFIIIIFAQKQRVRCWDYPFLFTHVLLFFKRLLQSSNENPGSLLYRLEFVSFFSQFPCSFFHALPVLFVVSLCVWRRRSISLFACNPHFDNQLSLSFSS